MSRILLSAAALALVLSLPNLADAQRYGGHFGHGFKSNAGYGFYSGYTSFNVRNSFHRPDNLPYFAKHPPVYYSKNIVKRPYGVSPYAAPAGTVPVELTLQPHVHQPLHIVNPYIDLDSPAPQSPPQESLIVPDQSDVAPLDSGQNAADPQPEPATGTQKDDDWEIVPDKDRKLPEDGTET